LVGNKKPCLQYGLKFNKKFTLGAQIIMGNDISDVDKNLQLEEDEKETYQEVLEWLKEKWLPEKLSCEICGETKWEIQQNVVSPLLVIKGNINVGKCYPQIMVICENCANTKYFNSLMIHSKLLKLKQERNKNGK
jgi:hypothetical protein